jgi:cytochrome b6-f complex iron-sulfur subunit
MTLAITSGTVAAIVVVVVLDMFAILFGLSFLRARRAQRAAEEEAASGRQTPPEPATKGHKPMSRRDFFRASLVSSLLVFGAQFGGASIAFMWPNLKGGFGSKINAGKLDDIKTQIQSSNQPYYFGAGRFYIVPYDGKPTQDANYAAEGTAAQGIMPLYQRCVHLGCRVPFCQSSQWFECPCHGSKYNYAGEYKLGPAPRGMDRFSLEVVDGDVIVDTSQQILGPPRGTDTISEPPKGAFCVAPG